MIPLKILIFGYDKAIVDIVELGLQSENFITHITIWRNISEQIKEFKPDLLILDFQFIESCQQIARDSTIYNVPFILISHPKDIEFYSHICDAAAYVIKPLDVLDFVNTVKDVLSI